MRRLPCAIHPANHALVQELSVVAALLKEQRGVPGTDSKDPQLPYGDVHDQLFLRAAKAIAHSPAAMEETLAYPKGYGIGKVWCDIEGPAERWVRSRLRAQEQGLQHAWREWKKLHQTQLKREEVERYRKMQGKQWWKEGAEVKRNVDDDENHHPANPIRASDKTAMTTAILTTPLRTSSWTSGLVDTPDKTTFSSSPSRKKHEIAVSRVLSFLFHSPFHPTPFSISRLPSPSSTASLLCATAPPPTSPIGRLLQHVFPILRYTAPFRLLAQHGPRLFLQRHLPLYLRDTLCYEEACRHRAILQAALQPLGFQVEMTGGFRRGAPQGVAVSFVVAFTRERVAALCKDVEEVEGETLWKGMPGRQKSGLEGEREESTDSRTLECQLCDASPADEPLLRRPIERALEKLARSGYLVAGRRLALPKSTFLSSSSGVRRPRPVSVLPPSAVEVIARLWSEEAYARQVLERKKKEASHTWQWGDAEAREDALDLTMTVAHEERSPDDPPPQEITDPADVLDVRLHTIQFYFVPVNCFFLQLFFLTGPASFTVEIMRRALERGKDLDVHGLYPIAKQHSSPSSSSSTSMPTKAHSLSLNTPSIPVTSEEVIFDAAGLSSSSSPSVHPFLRGIFCQLQKR